MRVLIMKAKLTNVAIAAFLTLAVTGPAVGQQPSGPSYGSPGPGAYPVSPEMMQPQWVIPTSHGVAVDPAPGKAGCAGGGCTDPQCAYCGSVCSSGIWGSAEYLMLWARGRALPPLVTSSPQGTPANAAGVLPNADILYGADHVGNDMLSAGRLTLGLWLDSGDTLGLAIRILGSETDQSGYNASSGGNPILARPFYNVDPLVNAQDALLVAYPGLDAGSVVVSTSSALFNGEVLGRINLDMDQCTRIDLVGGYHFSLIDDGLTIENTSTVTGGTNYPIGTVFTGIDDFNTRNEFHGGAIGVWYERYRGPWTISALAKVSIGQNNQSIRIRGSNTVVDIGGGSITTDGNLLAQPTNIGEWSQTKTIWIPELSLNLSRQITQRWDVTIGYTFLYWSSVVTAGDQIDTVVNGTQLLGGNLVGPARPAEPNFVDTSYWVHALSLGMNFRF